MNLSAYDLSIAHPPETAGDLSEPDQDLLRSEQKVRLKAGDSVRMSGVVTVAEVMQNGELEWDDGLEFCEVLTIILDTGDVCELHQDEVGYYYYPDEAR